MADGKELYDINWQEYFPEDWEWKGLPSEEYEERFSYENTAVPHDAERAFVSAT